MSKERKVPGWAAWAVVLVVGLPFLYVASFGPVCWLIAKDALPLRPAVNAYRPLIDFCYGCFPCDSFIEAQLHISDGLYWYGRTVGGKGSIDKMYSYTQL